MPAVGVRTESRTIAKIDGKAFASAGYLASYSGFAPVPWRSGTSKGQPRFPRLTTTGNAPRGKRHSQALIALARRRCDALFALLCHMTLYKTSQLKAA
ncbi:IS110 family transposase [Arthrobacter sp. CAU 1506]|nr:IS110 family transposase [Arthrobacter sp. CAU 1506]